MGGLTDEERAELEAQFRKEMEQDHTRRNEVLAFEKSLSKKKSARRKREERETDLAELRAEIRDRFYEENNYKRYVDSQGFELWLTPEEYEWRMRRRNRSRVRRRRWEPAMVNRGRVWAFYVGLAALAVLAGILLVR